MKAIEQQLWSVSYGSLAAAGDSILRVRFREITPDCYRQIRSLKISPQKPEYFSKADTENPKLRGCLRPTRDTGFNRKIVKPASEN
jgi:hypothetical protein